MDATTAIGAATKTAVGRWEWVALPGMLVNPLKARMDSGATGSALHAEEVTVASVAGVRYATFTVSPDEAPVMLRVEEMRTVRSSNGDVQTRPVVLVPVSLAGRLFAIEMTLTDRTPMNFPVLLGRNALAGRFVIDPQFGRLHRRPATRGGVMRTLILSARPDIYSTQRLLTEAHRAGLDVEVVDHRRCSLGIGTTARVMHRGLDLRPALVIPRIGPASSRFGAAVVRQFQAMGARTTTEAGAILRARDKFAAVQTMAAAGVPVPMTSAARAPSGIGEVLELVGGSPVVVKLVEGTHGSGVVLAETRKAAESLLAAFHQVGAELCVQEFVKEAGGQDLRALVVDGRVVAAIRRQAAQGEFRANLHQGGEAFPVELTDEEERVAVAASSCVGLAVAGVDMLRTEAGPLVLEANVSPGLAGVEQASGVNVAAEIVAYARRRLG